jgi:hypothetical protein
MEKLKKMGKMGGEEVGRERERGRENKESSGWRERERERRLPAEGAV